MKIAITGHRPEQIPDMLWVYNALVRTYNNLEVDHVIQGMAAGVDLFSALAAYESGIPYTCAKPWKGHAPREQDKNLYQTVIDHAERVVNVNESLTYTGPWLYHDRNHWMVDNAEAVIAVWDGSEKGGTFAAYTYATKTGKDVYRLDPKERKIIGWL